MSALRRAIIEHPVADGAAARLTRWRVRATRAVLPPLLHPVVPARARPNGVVGQMAFRFGGQKAGLEPQTPFSSEIRTEIELLSLTAIGSPLDGGVLDSGGAP